MTTLQQFHGLDLKIRNLHKSDDRWFWHLSGEILDLVTVGRYHVTENDVFFTNSNGEGIFMQRDADGAITQLVGTFQFSARQTSSGMRRALYRLFNGKQEGARE